VWVPNTSASRITNTVWWFLHDVSPDVSLLESNMSHAYPPTRDHPDPQLNGADLIGRVFMEPDIGVCLITALGRVVRHQLATRAQLQRQKQTNDPLLSQGNHFTLMYTQTSTGEEHFSSVAEILYWIATGPVLQPCESLVPTNSTNAPITTPPFTPATVQYVPTQTTLATGPVPSQKVPIRSRFGLHRHEREKTAPNDATLPNERAQPKPTNAMVRKGNEGTEKRVSPRLLAARDKKKHISEKQRVSERLGIRVNAHLASLHDHFVHHSMIMEAQLGPAHFDPHPDQFASPNPVAPPGYENMTVDEDIERFRVLVEELEQREACERIL
jgi:hypothetical protein